MTTGTDDWGREVDQLLDAEQSFQQQQGDGFDDFDAGDVDANKIGSGVIRVDKCGWYHLELTATARPEKHNPDNISQLRFPGISLACRVLVSTPGQSPEGSIHYHNLNLAGKGGGQIEDWDKRKTLSFLVGVGILVKDGDRVIDPETKTTKINSATLATRLNGMQIIGHLVPDESEDEKYKGHPTFLWGRGAFRIDDPAVKEVPKNEAALKAIGKAPQAPANGSTAKRETQAAPQQQPAAGVTANGTAQGGLSLEDM